MPTAVLAETRSRMSHGEPPARKWFEHQQPNTEALSLSMTLWRTTASACSYRQDPGGMGNHRSQHDQHIGEKEQPQHLPVQRLASPSQPGAFCASSGDFTGTLPFRV